MALGAVVFRLGSARLSDMSGLGRTMPITMGAFVIAGLAIIGTPGTVGFVSKWYLGVAAMEKGWWWLLFLIVASSLISVVYVGKVVEAVWFREPTDACAKASEPPMSMLLPMLLLVIFTVYFGIDTRLTAGIASQAADTLLAGFK